MYIKKTRQVFGLQLLGAKSLDYETGIAGRFMRSHSTLWVSQFICQYQV